MLNKGRLRCWGSVLSSKWSSKRSAIRWICLRFIFFEKRLKLKLLILVVQQDPANSNCQGQRKTVRVSGVRVNGVNVGQNLMRGKIKWVRESEEFELTEFELAGFLLYFIHYFTTKGSVKISLCHEDCVFWCIHLGSELVD